MMTGEYYHYDSTPMKCAATFTGVKYDNFQLYLRKRVLAIYGDFSWL